MNKEREPYTIDENVDFCFYIAGWILLGLGLLAVVCYETETLPAFLRLQLCIFHASTGYYCPGCGGTRAILAFLQGNLLKSFYYHPFVPYAAIVGGWFMFSRSLQYLSRGSWRIGMHFRPIWVIIALLLVLGNFLVKNGVLFFTGIALL